jgi:hypothetical protein
MPPVYVHSFRTERSPSSIISLLPGDISRAKSDINLQTCMSWSNQYLVSDIKHAVLCLVVKPLPSNPYMVMWDFKKSSLCLIINTPNLFKKLGNFVFIKLPTISFTPRVHTIYVTRGNRLLSRGRWNCCCSMSCDVISFDLKNGITFFRDLIMHRK